MTQGQITAFIDVTFDAAAHSRIELFTLDPGRARLPPNSFAASPLVPEARCRKAHPSQCVIFGLGQFKACCSNVLFQVLVR
jgi:hypothetical protein